MAFLSRAYVHFFRHIRVDAAWNRAVFEAQKSATVVYVLRNVSLIDYLALDYLTRERGFPSVGFVNELSPWLTPSVAALRRLPPQERLRRTLAAGHSAALFLKRAPSVFSPLGSTHRGRSEGDELLRVVLDVQRSGERDIVMMPQTFVWTMRPGRLGVSVTDAHVGPADFPGDLRAATQFLLNHKNCVLRAGEPLRLGEFLAAQDRGEGDDALVRRLTYALLRKVERERRAILGPAQKPVDRVREEVLRSPKLRATIRDLAGTGSAEQERLVERARDILREMEAAPDQATLRGLELVADTLVDRVYAGVDVDRDGLDRLRDAASRGSVVLLPSHRSHVDYLLMSYVLRKSSLQLPVVAAGDNLSFFPIGPLFRRGGAFFIRRSFRRDRLYATVVDAYIRRLLRDGYAIEFFLEGGRSRTGKLTSPKLGLLNMVVDAGLNLDAAPITFVPVSIGYERMMEERSFAREVSGEPKERESARALLKLSSVLASKYGRANVQFGQFIELSELLAEATVAGAPIIPARRRAVVNRLAQRVMTEINAVTAVTPGALVALALLSSERRGVPHLELTRLCSRLAKLLIRRGARTTPSLVREGSSEVREAAIREAALTFVRAKLIRQYFPGDTLTGGSRRRARLYTGDDVVYTIPGEHRLELDLAKNHIVHFFVDRAVVSTAMLTASSLPIREPELLERIRSLSRLLAHEFPLLGDGAGDELASATLTDMESFGEVSREGGAVSLGPGHDEVGGKAWAAFYASTIRNFLEAYRIAARTARILARGPLSAADLATRALRVGEQMYLGGEIERAEAVCRPVVENAFRAFLDLGYVRRVSDKLALSEGFDSDEAAVTIEARIAGELVERAEEGRW